MKLLCMLFLLLACSAAQAETLSLEEMLAAEDAVMITQVEPEQSAAREDFIDRIIATA